MGRGERRPLIFTRTPRIFLDTGPPRCGKSKVIEKLVRQIARPVTGFYLRQIRERGGKSVSRK